MIDNDVSFGRWLKRRRKSLDLTQELLAERTHCSLATIQKIESEARRPSRQLAELLAEALEIPPAERPLFLKIARGERSAGRLARVAAQPSLRIATRPRNNLPHAATPLLGRESELAELARLVRKPDCRLLTITGQGGIGKTRLVLGLAADCQDLFGDGVFYVPLAPLSCSEYIEPAIADALGLAMCGPGKPRAQLLHYLREREMLLVLDNLEHLLDDLSLLSDILQYAPRVKLLATSRQQLEMQGEVVFRLEGLPAPASGSTEAVDGNSALQLFLYTAERLHLGFSLTDEDRAAAVEICRLLDGLPLGIELAAAWTNVLSCREIAAEIRKSLDFLAASTPDRPERHRSLRAVFDHSWRLLSAEEQRVLRRLAVFRGGLARDAAERVAGASLPDLSALCNKSLLYRTSAGRFDMHESVRQYSALRLDESNETELARERHFKYYLSLAEAAESKLTSAEWKAWSNRLDAEHDNLRAALEWGAAQTKDAEPLVRLAGSLYWFWLRRGDLSEGRVWLERALGAGGDQAAPLARARALYGAGCLALAQGHFVAVARDLLEQSVALWRSCGAEGQRGLAYALVELGEAARHDGDLAAAGPLSVEGIALLRGQGDRWGLAYALDLLGMIVRDATQFAEARLLIDESIGLWRGLGDTWGLARALHQLALVALRQGDYDTARSRAEEALSLQRKSTDRQGVGYSLHTLGVIALNQDDLPRARRRFQEGYDVFSELEDRYGIASALQYTGHIALLEGDATRAQSLIEEALALSPEVGPKWFGALCLARLAGVIAVCGKPEQAVQLWAASEALMAAAASYMDTADRIYYERTIESACAGMDEGILDTARAEGRLLSLEQALQLGLAAVCSGIE